MPPADQIAIVSRLHAAIEARDGDAVELALMSALEIGLHPNMCGALVALSEAGWHTRHEDVVRAIRALRCESAVRALERTAHATHAYLDYDGFFALARKCTWALADIGTPDAYQALERLSNSSNPLIAQYAQKRLIG
jgi:hypothetical protein